MADALFSTFTALYDAMGGISSSTMIPYPSATALLRGHPPVQQEEILVAGAKFGHATTTLVESQRVKTSMIVSWISHS